MFKALKAFYQQRWQRWLDRRIPREREITLNQRRIFIFLSRQGLLAALMVFTLFIAGINYANNLLLGLCFFIGSLFVIAIHHTYANLSGLRIRALATAPAFAGEWAKLTLRLDDARLRTHNSLHVNWGESEQHIAQVAAEHDIVIELPVLRRGWYRPPRLKLSTVYPLGWLRAWTWLDMDMPVLVYPHPEPLAEIPTQAGEQGDGERRRRVGQEDFDSLKAFTPGDPLAHISWKHAARGQGLLTKTFSAEEAGSEVLDWDVLSGHTIEKRLSYLTWWVLRLSQESRPFGLVLPGQRFDIASGLTHREACLKALALFGRSDTEGATHG